jgi:hypothetical protein
MKKSTSPQGIASTIRRAFISRRWRDSELRNVNLTDAVCGLAKAVESLVLAMQEDDGEEEEAQNQ